MAFRESALCTALLVPVLTTTGFRFQQGAVTEGRVVSQATGSPLRNAEVKLKRVQHSQQPVGKSFAQQTGWIAFALAAMPILAQSRAVEVSVVDALTKAPISGAVVTLYRGDKAVHSGASDVQGLFRIDGLMEGEYRVAVDHSEHLSLALDQAVARRFVVSAATGEVRLSAELAPFAQLAGRVLNPTGQTMKDVGVCLRRLWDHEWSQVAHSDLDGRFHFRRLDQGARSKPTAFQAVTLPATPYNGGARKHGGV